MSGLLAALLGACVGESYGYGVSAGVATPGYVSIGYGVDYVPGFNRPLFYDGSSYWLYADRGWYHSRYYDHGWAYARRVPRWTSRIGDPHYYVRSQAFNRPRYIHRGPSYRYYRR